ncbi:hypothetical protein Sango_0365800 [Sesamum angolense]|uniref:RNase H type-1 domain-containing protein n=1 Tax=Sesamum angolense TaxID=2727404 RepID=A0AAE1XAI0_9LAMI|nr:hypothetical protein Sango_0365800 [Sesamum angolense]
MCGDLQENIKHVFLECHFARQAWALSHLPLGVISEWHNRAADWVKHVRSQLEHEDFNLFVMICWRLWGRRNKRTMENIDFHPGECVVSAINILRDFYNVVSTKSSLSPSADRWSVPEVETVKINFDASILRNREEAGLGAIARDHSGRCIAWRMAFVPNVANPELSEAMAARLAIEIWRRFQWNNCIIEGDYIQIVHKLNSKETAYSDIGPVLHDIRSSLDDFANFKICFVRRSANLAAHHLPRVALNSMQ